MSRFKWNGKNETAQSWAADHAAQRVTVISDETRTALKALVARSIREGVSPYDAARQIRGLIGLNVPQAVANMKYRAQLEASGLRADKVEAKVQRYYDKQIRTRAMTISRTETLDALNEGKRAGYEQAYEDGWLSAQVQVEWIATEAACPICLPFNGMTIPLHGAEFPAGDPPIHPRCECTTALVEPKGSVVAPQAGSGQKLHG